MDLTQKSHVELLFKFDQWFNYPVISKVFQNVGFGCDLSSEEYELEIHELHRAMHDYPEMEPHEAFAYQKKHGFRDPQGQVYFMQNVIYNTTVPDGVLAGAKPCCGGGKVR